MKKKILSILISVFAICTFMFTLSACGGGEPPHTHVYDQQVVNDTFKASNATCEDKATYFYSCSCGEGGLETFEVGEALGHAYSNWASNGNNTHSKTCANDNTHIITEDCSGGTPTETQRPVCKDCHTEYGESLGHIHTLHLTKVDAKPQSCTKEGNIEYYTCSCDKWFTDNTATTEITDKTSVVIEKDDHKHNILKHNETEHWYECSCGDKATAVGHIPGAEATETTDQKCTVCEHVITPALGHVHTLHLTKVGAKPQSCTATGNIEYYTCSCGKWFTDNTATTEITDKTSVVIVKDNHKHSILKYNETEHWYECTCGDRATAEGHKGGAATCQVKATCSVCGEKYGTLGSHQPKTEWVTTETHHYHECKTSGCTEKLNYGEHNFDSNKKCGGCDYVTTALLGTEISSNVYEISGTNLFVKVPNAQTNFSFAKTINIAKSATYKVYTDISCKKEYCIPSYVVNDLKEENNVYYFLVSNKDEIPQVYTVTVRRRPKYTVTFNTDGGSYVAPQTIEEDSLATKPNNPTKTGYDFVSWDYDFTTPIITNKTIKANWAESTKTPYRVEYYLENLENDNYSILSSATENLTGTTNSTVYADIKTFEHFTAEKTSVSCVIAANGTTVLKVYYQRDEYTVTFDGNGGTLISGDEVQTVKYGGSVVAPNYIKEGHTFVNFNKMLTNVSENLTITANWNVNQYSITVIYGNGQDDKIITQEFGSEITEILPSILEREYYVFNGWDKDLPLNMPSKNLIVKANWKAKNYTIKYDLGGGNNSSINPSEYNVETPTILLQEPIKVGYTFAGWFLESDFRTEITIIEKGSHDDIELFAFWRANLNTIIFNGNGSTNGTMSPIQAYTGESIILPKNLYTNTADYTFKGWFIMAEGVKFFDDCAIYKVGTEGEQILYADWSQQTDTGLIWNATGNNEVTIVGCLSEAENVKVPSTIAGMEVTVIGSEAFKDCIKLQRLEINAKIESIGANAFYGCDKLEKVNYSRSFASVTAWAYTIEFSNKYSNPIYYAKNLYIYNELVTEISINSAIEVSPYAFIGCSSIRSVVLGNNVKGVGGYAFYGCDKLKNISIGNNIGYMGTYAFGFCLSLESIYFNAKDCVCGYSTESNQSNLVFYESGQSGAGIEIVFGESVTKVPDYLFNSNGYRDSAKTKITKVIIGNNVSRIGVGAFNACDYLTSLTIGEKVSSIGVYAFYRCYRMVEVINKSPNITVTRGHNSGSYVGQFALEVFNHSDEYINKFTYDNECLIYNDGVDKILCAYLGTKAELNLPSYITKINSYSFYNSFSLTNITISNSVTDIGSGAFYNCTQLTSVTIPNSVTSIGDSAFYWCDSLINVYYNGTEEEWENINIGNYNGDLTSAIRYYYIENQEDVPTDGGNYWHYDENGNPVIW